MVRQIYPFDSVIPLAIVTVISGAGVGGLSIYAEAVFKMLEHS